MSGLTSVAILQPSALALATILVDHSSPVIPKYLSFCFLLIILVDVLLHKSLPSWDHVLFPSISRGC